jgi:hypothetical protein
MKSAFRLVAVVILAVFTGACIPTGLMQVRPERLYERSPTDQTSYRKVADLDVTMRAFTLFGFPIALPNLVATIDSRIQEADADAVTNLEVESRLLNVLLIFGSSSYTATGDLIVYE